MTSTLPDQICQHQHHVKFNNASTHQGHSNETGPHQSRIQRMGQNQVEAKNLVSENSVENVADLSKHDLKKMSIKNRLIGFRGFV